MTDLAVPTNTPLLPISSQVADNSSSRLLSQILRASTERAHKEVELRLGMPESIVSVCDYLDCLLRFYQLYRPMESEFDRFSDWAELGLVPAALESSAVFSSWLASDLRVLGLAIADIADAPASSLPPLNSFASALGARYVVEGSALGGQYMLPQLKRTLGDAMAGADTFFQGRGYGTGAFWRSFRAALDLYGDRHPEQIAQVVTSAVATFQAVGIWMRP